MRPTEGHQLGQGHSKILVGKWGFCLRQDFVEVTDWESAQRLSFRLHSPDARKRCRHHRWVWVAALQQVAPLTLSGPLHISRADGPLSRVLIPGFWSPQSPKSSLDCRQHPSPASAGPPHPQGPCARWWGGSWAAPSLIPPQLTLPARGSMGPDLISARSGCPLHRPSFLLVISLPRCR